MRRLHRTTVAALAGLMLAGPVFADGFTVIDVAGREVAFDAPVERVILGEGRMLVGLLVLVIALLGVGVVIWPQYVPISLLFPVVVVAGLVLEPGRLAVILAATVAVLVVWGGLVASVLFLRRRPAVDDEVLSDPDRDDAVG